MADKLGLLTEGFKLNMEQRGLIIRVLWVVTVTAYMAWSLGMLAAFGGASSPHASASDLKKSQEATQQAVAPMAAGLKSMLESDILALEEDVDVMTARKAADPAKWTELDQRLLTRKSQILSSKRTALLEMLKAEEPKK